MELWTVSDTARYLKQHPETIRRKVRQGAIPYLRYGRWLRFRKEAIDDWLVQGCPRQREQPPDVDHTREEPQDV